ncbi:MAG TPA: hypothetical protein VMT38_00380 [Terracidiphilus sp.]|nr:hypothetical protein [Terracidiphilus sp.]
MNLIKKLAFIFFTMALCSLPGWAQVIVNYPANGAVVAPQFSLSAYDSTCSGQPVSAMGFSLDSSSTNTFVYNTSIYSTVNATAGGHVLHVKAWGNAGSGCDTDVAITVDGVSVSAPGNNAPISQTFTLVANSATCSQQPVSWMGYSFDNGATAFVAGNSMNGSVTAPSGAQTLHVKSWGNQGSGCDTDVALNIAGAAPTSSDGVSVSEPANNATVDSLFALDAASPSCYSQAVSAMGYSLDNSTSTAIVYNTSIAASVTASSGAHVVHVKSWGNQGAACDTDVNINVTGSGGSATSSSSAAPSGGSGPYVPSGAASVSNIQAFGDWISNPDPGAGGSAGGAMAMVGSPSLTGNALEFYTTYSWYGGELYYASFGDDTNAHNFVYDGWVYLDGSSGSVANLEMDMNQVVSNGYTIIFGLQCDGWNGTWDFTENAGSGTAPVDRWVSSSASCNPRNWAQNTWHHVQASYSRDDYGNVTYQSVWLDGNQQQINATVPSAFYLGWAPTLVTNFQVDSVYAGWSSSNVYLDNLTISRW